mmetsp:Transcript_95149/g.208068  ORF Transcript_95149/g.208068 Transcript_95149/m.208068 type:complete len:193 (-) Transcript_95149:253-831(-)
MLRPSVPKVLKRPSVSEAAKHDSIPQALKRPSAAQRVSDNAKSQVRPCTKRSAAQSVPGRANVHPYGDRWQVWYGRAWLGIYDSAAEAVTVEREILRLADPAKLTSKDKTKVLQSIARACKRRNNLSVSKYRGVSGCGLRWKATLGKGRARWPLGTFPTQQAAAEAIAAKVKCTVRALQRKRHRIVHLDNWI